MYLRRSIFVLACLLSLPLAARAQDFGIAESAETINHRNFKLRLSPIVIFGNDNEANRTGFAATFGYGFTKSFDAEGQVAFYDGVTIYGGNAEWWIVKESPLDFSVAGGIHRRTGSKTADYTGVDLTFLASGHVNKRLELYGGLDIAFEGVGDPGDYKTFHLVPGLEYKINESIDLDVEFGIALNDFARHYLCGGLSFYIR